MPRPLVIGNGRLLINFDGGLTMRDLYYPRVGMRNHISGHRNAFGVWVDGRLSWVDEPGWVRRLSYQAETLVTAAVAVHPQLQIEVRVHDAVHVRHDIYLKRLEVINRADRQREVRVMFTHDFSIDQSEIGDTALYDLATDAVMHYKGNVCLLISGRVGQRGIYQYATGTKRFRGAEGTWRDAEDGNLDGNPIAQGSVDSTISFQLQIAPGGSQTVRYWIAAGDGFDAVRRLHRQVLEEGVDALLEHTRAYWRSWVNKTDWDLRELPPEVAMLFKRSLLIVRTQIDRGGAIIAANDTDILAVSRDHYSYVWPRDGALVATALDRAGFSELTREFYRFCARVISPEGFLWHKYHPDGSVGSSWHPWLRNGQTQLPIQEDETALVLHALGQFFQRDRDHDFIESLYPTLIRPAADFLCRYRDPESHLPLDSYDLWEERRGVFTFTAAAVWAGLRAAGRFAALLGDARAAEQYRRAAAEVKAAVLERLYSEKHGRFLRGLVVDREGNLVEDETLESSVYGVAAFGLLPAADPRMVKTMRAVEQGLWVKTDVGGIARYSNDRYFQVSHDLSRIPGNPWIICTMWLAQYYVERAHTREDLEVPERLLGWAVRRAMESGVLPVQVHPETGEPISVAPLTWSHASFILAVIKYLERRRQLEERQTLAAAWHASPYSG
ncbi:MAG TPA: glycoside hydrolase family 15 protein [Limnochordia bacterium]